jgi:putative hemolysin
MWELIGIAACLVASAFFSGSETALTQISPARAELLIDREPGRYGLLRVWIASRKRILATLLVGNNLVNILCSILGYRVAVSFLPGYAEAISVFGLTLVILVFSEITPKSFALHRAERVAVPLLRIVWIVDKLLLPLAWPLSRIPGLLFGKKSEAEENPPVTEDEIEYHIRQGIDREVFEEKEQGELLRSVMEFPDIMVKEIMIPRTDIVGLDEGTSVLAAVEMVTGSGHSRVPVFEGSLDRITGLLYAKDLLGRIHSGEEAERMTVGQMKRGEPMFVPETQKINVLLADMRRRGMHMAAVVDEFGGTAGLVTMEDIIEEIVGEIRDEFDAEEEMLVPTGDGKWSVDARMSIYDLMDEVELELPDTGDYESVGGFVVAQFGRIPRKGRVIAVPGAELTVTEADARRVKRLELRKVQTAAGKDG